MTNTRRSETAFLGVSALAFVASAAVTVIWCASMSTMPGMEMPGGWTMSMAWMRMPGQSWLGAAATFLGMWTVMMIAMMLPSLMPMLLRYRQSAGAGGGLTAIVAAAYFIVWTMSGVAAFPLGVALAEMIMLMPALAHLVPIAAGVVIVIAGVLQFSAWKERQLACCRTAPMHGLPANEVTAFRHGLRIGFHCVRCCAGLTAVLLVFGVMDLRAMAVVTAATTAERLLPRGERIARLVGALTVGAGLCMLSTGFATD